MNGMSRSMTLAMMYSPGGLVVSKGGAKGCDIVLVPGACDRWCYTRGIGRGNGSVAVARLACLSQAGCGRGFLKGAK